VDALAEFFPLLLVVLYYLVTGRRKAAARKQQAQSKKAPQEPLVTDEAPSGPTPFQSFLAQLEDAMAEANGTNAPPPAATPPPPPPRPPKAPKLARRTESEFHALSGSFDSVAPTDHNRHGFSDENPLSEASLEHRSGASATPRQRREYDPHGLERPAPPPTAPPDWRNLSNSEIARHAFVLQTVFGPRGGRRGERR